MWTFRPTERSRAGMASCGDEASDGGADDFGDEDDMVEAQNAKVAWGWQVAGGSCRLVISKRLQEVQRAEERVKKAAWPG